MEDSGYFKALNGPAQARYRQKLLTYIGYDPYDLVKSDLSYNLNDLPPLSAMDITSYLVLHTSYYTASQMKAYKSLEAYNYFVCGWVSGLGSKEALDGCRLVFGRVNHSQRSTEKPLKTWFVARESGEVVTAHCDCMAGLSESCSHVGALLFATEAGIKMKESASCTTERCQWLMPSHIKKIPAAPVAKIDFSSARSKKHKLDEAIAKRAGDQKTYSSTTAQPCPKVQKGSETYQQFFEALKKNVPQSAALMSRSPYHRDFIPKSVSLLPKTLLAYRTSETVQLSPADLQTACSNFRFEELSQSQIQAVEEETRTQSSSTIWFRQRAGRITASKLKQVIQSSLLQPSKSLIKSICYPETQKLSTAAIRYGCKYEKEARTQYEKLQQLNHERFTCMDSGLWLNKKWPYMGASPDGAISCDCHGSGICEIKCPQSKQDCCSLRMCAGEPGFCLVKDGDGVKLDRKHPYFYQVQAQLHIVGVDYCDFVVWTQHDVYVERILPDNDLWGNVVPRVQQYFEVCILPEILGQKFTSE